MHAQINCFLLLQKPSLMLDVGMDDEPLANSNSEASMGV